MSSSEILTRIRELKADIANSRYALSKQEVPSLNLKRHIIISGSILIELEQELTTCRSHFG